MKKNWNSIALIGAGNIGTSIAGGLAASGTFQPSDITLTRRRLDLLESWASNGFRTTSDNRAAIQDSDIILIAVEPQQVDSLLEEIRDVVDPDRHMLISVVTGVGRVGCLDRLGGRMPVIRAAADTAIAIRESMDRSSGTDEQDVKTAEEIFDPAEQTMVVREEQVTAATALSPCGIAF